MHAPGQWQIRSAVQIGKGDLLGVLQGKKKLQLCEKEKDLRLCESQSVQKGQFQSAAVRKSDPVNQYRKRSTDSL